MSMQKVSNSGPKLMQGNEACAAGALAAGCRFMAGYPITPATEIPEYLSDKMFAAGGVFMQMEDELRRFLTQPRPAEEVLALAKQLGISERTLKIAKRNLGILSERRADQWLWRLPEQEGKGATP